MTQQMIADMSQAEFKDFLEAVVENTVERKLLEILGDPDEGLEVRHAVQKRLLRQKRAVAASHQRGQALDDVVSELGLD